MMVIVRWLFSIL